MKRVGLTLVMLVTPVVADCKSTDNLDGFLTGSCSCASKGFQVSYAMYSAAVDFTKVTGGACIDLGLVTCNYSVSPYAFCTNSALTPNVVTFPYSDTGYTKVLLGSSSSPVSISAADSKACSWKSIQVTKKGSRYLAICQGGSQNPATYIYYGSSPPCSPATSTTDTTCTAFSSAVPGFRATTLAVLGFILLAVN